MMLTTTKLCIEANNEREQNLSYNDSFHL
jgi:hypothetical protein